MSEATADTYLIFSVEHSRWWGPEERGYVSAISNAGRYSRERALRICLNAMPGTAREGVLQELPVREADALEMAERCEYRSFLGGLL